RTGGDQTIRLPHDRKRLQGFLAVAALQVRGGREQRSLLSHALQTGHGGCLAGDAVRNRPYPESSQRWAVWRRPPMDRLAISGIRIRDAPHGLERHADEGGRQ